MRENILNQFQIFQSESLSDFELEKAVSELFDHFQYIPQDYVDFVRDFQSEVEFSFGTHGYLRIWLPVDCISTAKNFEEFEITELVNMFPFADDGGSRFLYYSFSLNHSGIYTFPYGGGKPVFVANSLQEILFEGIGLKFIYTDF
jgi:hypothetical protein